MKHTEQCIETKVPIQTALQQLDYAPKKILFLLENGVLKATLTDGDVRRYLLSGGGMDDSVLKAANCQPKTARTRREAQKLLQQEASCIAIPVVESSGILRDIVFSAESCPPQYPSLNLPVVIMAGGRGTRLEPYTKVLPKPLLPVGELPIIEHIMQRFEEYDCNAFHIVVNYKRQLLKAYFNESCRHYHVRWYDEEQPLGTGGGLYLLKGQIHTTFFLTNCDILLRADYADMLRFHHESRNVITMIGAYKNLTIPYGVINIGKDGVIEAMQEKPELSFLTNTGVYIVEPEVLEDIPDNTVIGFPDIIEQQRQKGRKTAVYPVSEDEWLDMGQLTELESMRKQLYGE